MSHGWAGLLVALLAILMLFAQFGGNERAKEMITPPKIHQDSAQAQGKAYVPIEGWPPQMDEPYPNIRLLGDEDVAYMLESLKGRIIFIIPTYMHNPESQVLAGALEHGAFDGMRTLLTGRYDASITALFKKALPDIKLPHNDIAFVHLILKNQVGQQASAEDARKWRAHFKLSPAQGHHVVALADGFSPRMWDEYVPGIHVLDDEFKLRAMNSGTKPEHDLNDIIFPMVRVMLDLKAARYENVIDP